MLFRSCEKFGLQISTAKTELMCSNKFPSLITIEINGEAIKETEHFKILGSLISADGSLELEIKTRIPKAQAVFSSLYHKFWSRKHISLGTKLSSFKVVVRAVLLYACETWPAQLDSSNNWKVFSIDVYKESLGKGGTIS